MTENVPFETLQIFDHTEYRTDQNEKAGSIESDHVLLPRCIQCSRCRHLPQSDVKESGNKDEGAEEEELDEETTDDDVLTNVD